jgi:hypothetical protein
MMNSIGVRKVSHNYVNLVTTLFQGRHGLFKSYFLGGIGVGI